MSEFEHEWSESDSYRDGVFVGVGQAETYTEAKELAVQDAWEHAKQGGAKVLRLTDEWVGGTNPITWCRVVLSER